MKEETNESQKTEEKKVEYEFTKKPRGGFGAIFLIAIGTIFLLNNFELLPWTIWVNIWRLWPVILIFIGLRIIAGRNMLTNFIITILVLIFFALVILIPLARYNLSVDRWLKENIPSWSVIEKSAPINYDETQSV
jgi:hypothetical protein